MPNTIAEQIRQARTRAGLTQEQLADAVGTSRFRVLEWEKGKHRPSPRRLALIAEATGERITEEYGDGDDDESEPSRLLLERMHATLIDDLIAALRHAKDRVPA